MTVLGPEGGGGAALAPAATGAVRGLGRRRAGITPLAAAAVAWALLMAVEGSPFAWVLDHDALALTAVPLPLAVAGYLAGWALMVAAMMLPGALAMAAPPRLAGWLGGFLAAWCLAGLAFAGLDLALHALLPPGDRVASALPAAAAVGAAVWSIFVPARPTGGPRLRRGARRGFAAYAAAGWLHGLSCVASCWPVMLAVQALSPGGLGAMAGAALLTTLRLAAGRRRLSRHR